MRILFGVPVKVHKEIAEAEVNAFRAMGNEVEVSFYGNSDQIKGFVSRLILILKNATNLKRKLIKQKSDIVYLNTAFDNKTLIRDSITIFILKYRDKKVKVILKTHGSIKSSVFSKSIFKKYLFKHTDLFLVLSREELHNFIQAGLEKKKAVVTANVVDRSSFLTDKEFRKKNAISQDELVLLYVGRFIKEKGILDLICACKLLKESFCSFQLICLGDGPLFIKAQSLSDSFGLKNNIKFAGHVDEFETSYFYSNSDILILPTYHEEGFPMAVFKAAGCGKPIITTKIRAAADYFKSFQNCLWVEPKDPKSIYQKIKILAHDKDLRQKMGRNNFDLVNRFSAERIVNDLYLELLNLLKKQI